MNEKPLEPERIFAPTDPPLLVGRQGELLREVPSTMAVARERLLEGAPDGYVVLAEHQTAGRGRRGAWECPRGMGLLASVVLRIALPTSEQTLVVLLGAVAATEAVRRQGVPARIKWPNDVVVAAGEPGTLTVRKLGGLLVDRVRTGDAGGGFVLGIGLNVNQGEADLPAGAPVRPTSLRMEKGRRFDRTALCRALLAGLSAWYRRLRMGKKERVLARWRRLSCLLDQPVRAEVEGRRVAGKVVGLRSTGELILQTADGSRRLLSDQSATLLL